ncbi:MAG: hypothetical protein RR382_11620, partial [Tannerellaceae bacterium]
LGEKTIAGINQRNSYILGRFFLFSEHQIDSTKVTASFDLSYDPKQKVSVNDKGQRVYNLFLRVLMKQESGGSLKPGRLIIPNAFAIQKFVETAGAVEKQAGGENLYFCINYVKGFNRDTTAVTWASSDVFTLTLPNKNN